MYKFLLLLFFLFVPVQATAQSTLVLVIDLSISISDENKQLQMDSYATAMDWITPLEHMNIEVIVFGKQAYHISSGSRQNAATAFRINQDIDRSSTCLYRALEYVELMYDTLPQPVIIDISGDGEENCDPNEKTYALLDRLALKGAIVNTLMIPLDTSPMLKWMPPESIEEKEQDLKNYYQSLTRGRGSFFMYIEHFYDFEDAIIRKIVKEISLLE